jgi:hypothetical protein
VNQKEEVTDLVAWVFSDNHEAIAADGRVADLNYSECRCVP